MKIPPVCALETLVCAPETRTGSVGSLRPDGPAVISTGNPTLERVEWDLDSIPIDEVNHIDICGATLGRPSLIRLRGVRLCDGKQRLRYNEQRHHS